MELPEFVAAFATAVQEVDAAAPRQPGKKFREGFGPLGEDFGVDLVVGVLKRRDAARFGSIRVQVPYPNQRKKLDISIGSPQSWAIEVKMARARGDNGKPDEYYLKDLLSPYREDNGVVGDAAKLRASTFPGRKAVLVYGFDHEDRQLDAVIEVIEFVLERNGRISERYQADFADLIHPVHSRGRVFAWELV